MVILRDWAVGFSAYQSGNLLGSISNIIVLLLKCGVQGINITVTIGNCEIIYSMCNNDNTFQWLDCHWKYISGAINVTGNYLLSSSCCKSICCCITAIVDGFCVIWGLATTATVLQNGNDW